MVPRHVFRERLDVLVAGFGDRLLGGGDVDGSRGVGDMRNLRIGEFSLRERRAAHERDGGDRRTQSNEHV